MPALVPRLRDEFSYLLAADTFASGRLTNPPHPLWKSFESIHILQRPTYMSMYPPAQGMFLALGQKLAGMPWLGVWLSMGLFCAALCWMLQGWLPPGWAFFGALLAVARIGVFTYWTNTYWGGAVAGIGGALLFGALPRVMRRANVRDALLMAAGIVLLMNSRPYEGLVAAIPAAAMLAWWLARGRGDRKLRLFAAPVAGVLLLGFAWMGYYNWRVTGDALLMPQELNRRTYAVAPYFVWQEDRPAPHYNNEVMEKFYTKWEGGFQQADQQDTIEGWLASLGEKAYGIWHFYLGKFLTAPLLLLPLIVKDRRIRFWMWAGPVFLAGLLLERFTQIHYVAPFAGGLYLLLTQCLRHLRQIKWEGAGVLAVRLVALYVAGIFAWSAVRGDQGFDYPWQFDRAQLEDRLEKMPGKQLVVVRYSQDHEFDREWVYNRADIDGSKVVWARELPDAGDNRRLLGYFKDRKVWLLEPDVSQEELETYDPDARR